MTDTAAELLKAIDAHIDARIAAALPPNPVPDPPTPPRSGLSVVNGVLMEDGKPFRDWSVSMTSWSIFASSDGKLTEFLNELQARGCRVIRVLHWYGFEGEDIQNYLEVRLRGMDRLFHEWVGKRGGHIWFCPFHRQCYTGPQQTDFGTIKVWSTLQQHRGQAGIPTEISDLFLWDDVLEEIVMDNMSALLMRVNTITGRRWIDEISILEFANEKLSARGYIGDASNLSRDATLLDADGRDGAFLRRLWRFREATGRTGQNKFSAPECREMQAWNGYTVYGRFEEEARNLGFQGVTIASSLYGNATMACLSEMLACQMVGAHVYPTSIKELPDPFTDNPVRTIHSIVNAIRCLPVALGEVNGANEGAGPAISFLTAPGYTAGCGASLVSWYSAAQANLDNTNPASEIYNLWSKRKDWWAEFVDGGKYFARAAKVPLPEKQLTYDELFGVKGEEAPIPGTQDWSKSVGGVALPPLEWMK